MNEEKIQLEKLKRKQRSQVQTRIRKAISMRQTIYGTLLPKGFSKNYYRCLVGQMERSLWIAIWSSVRSVRPEETWLVMGDEELKKMDKFTQQ
jgi:hypothetical protein